MATTPAVIVEKKGSAWQVSPSKGKRQFSFEKKKDAVLKGRSLAKESYSDLFVSGKRLRVYIAGPGAQDLPRETIQKMDAFFERERREALNLKKALRKRMSGAMATSNGRATGSVRTHARSERAEAA